MLSGTAVENPRDFQCGIFENNTNHVATDGGRALGSLTMTIIKTLMSHISINARVAPLL